VFVLSVCIFDVFRVCPVSMYLWCVPCLSCQYISLMCSVFVLSVCIFDVFRVCPVSMYLWCVPCLSCQYVSVIYNVFKSNNCFLIYNMNGFIFLWTVFSFSCHQKTIVSSSVNNENNNQNSDFQDEWIFVLYKKKIMALG